MKRLTNFRIFVAAAAAAAPLALAHANDFTPTGQSGYFQQAAAMPQASDQMRALQQGMHVRKNALGWEFITYDNPAGPQGPIRGEENPQVESATAAQQGFWRNMYPIGDSDTP